MPHATNIPGQKGWRNVRLALQSARSSHALRTLSVPGIEQQLFAQPCQKFICGAGRETSAEVTHKFAAGPVAVTLFTTGISPVRRLKRSRSILDSSGRNN